MREIKFRGLFESVNGIKTMVYGNYIKSYCGGKEYHEIEKSDFDDFKKWTVDPKTIGEFTGLIDKNGKEISEGDIFSDSLSGIKWEIIFMKGAFFCSHQDDNLNMPLCIIEKWDTLEIIGNIHENPELLTTNPK